MQQPIPFVGQHGTKACGSDCYPVEVTSVNKSGKKITVREMEATPAPGHDFYANQVYTYSSNPGGADQLLTLRKDGRYYPKGQPMGFGGVTLGVARFYQNPSF